MAALGASGVIAGCGSSKGGGESAAARAAQEAARRNPGRWLRYDAARRTAQITLKPGYNEFAAGYNIDGAVKGALLFSVPAGWTVSVRCVNASEAVRYSCVLERAPGKLVVDPAAVDVLHPSGGLGHGQTKVFTLPKALPAEYRLAAVTKGARPSGMWVVLKIGGGGRPYAKWLR